MLSFQNKITADIIEALQAGVKPWTCPWSVNGEKGFPYNFSTKMQYSGINVFILWHVCRKNGFTSNAWLTFNQVRKLGGHVNKRSKGTTCIFYTFKEIEDKESGDLRKIPLAKSFVVFNLNQVEGVEYDRPVLNNTFNSIERCEEILKLTQADIVIKPESNLAFYTRKQDQIVLPGYGAFGSPEDFYATALHELVHWTGHEKRLDRKKGAVFGDKDYAFEELVAELGSAFLCGELDLQGDLQHASYIDAWLKILKENSHAIFTAASLAAKAHKFIRNFSISNSNTNAA